LECKLTRKFSTWSVVLQKRNFNELTVRNTNMRSLLEHNGDPRLTLLSFVIKSIYLWRNS